MQVPMHTVGQFYQVRVGHGVPAGRSRDGPRRRFAINCPRAKVLLMVVHVIAAATDMGGRLRHRLSLSSMVAAVLLLCPAAVAAARAQYPDSSAHQESGPSDSSPCTHEEHTVAAVAGKARLALHRHERRQVLDTSDDRVRHGALLLARVLAPLREEGIA